MIDEYYDYCCGVLEYRSLCFETETIYMEDFQSSVVVNYTEREVPYTRIIEHKHFEGKCTPNTIIQKNIPKNGTKGMNRIILLIQNVMKVFTKNTKCDQFLTRMSISQDVWELIDI